MEEQFIIVLLFLLILSDDNFKNILKMKNSLEINL